MGDLRAAFESMGFENVKTVLASGNVIFDTASSDTGDLERQIEKKIPRAVGFETDVIVLRFESLRKLAGKRPFRGFGPDSQTRLYVTFVKGDLKDGLKFPVKGKGFAFLKMYGQVVCSFVDPAQGNTTDMMRELDKIWKVNTTRGWNTIERILK